MSPLRFILRGLAYHRRLHAGLLLGALLASGILDGALLVGDSVDYSLHRIASARLGNITSAMDWGSRFFGQDLAAHVRHADPRVQAAALLALRGMAALPPGQEPRGNQLNGVRVLGVDADFWKLSEDPSPAPALGPQEAAVNEKTAKALGLKPGDDLSLRLFKFGMMAQDAPLSSREDELTVSSLVTVKAVLSDAQLGRFSLRANQTTPFNVFVNREWLQEQAGQAGLANVFVAGGERSPEDVQRALDHAWELEDIGLRLRTHPSGILQVESARIFLDEEAVRAALTLPGAFPTFTYLVNSITKDSRTTPYSFVEAGPVPPELRDDEVIINQWLAEQLDAGPGDTIEIAYSQLLSTNTFSEQQRKFRVHSVRSMDAMAVERELAPQFPGLSDVESCHDWHIGMPMDAARLSDPANESYWKSYRQTPKLLTTFKAGKEMWGNRFGTVTAIRLPLGAQGESEIRRQLRAGISPERAGLQLLPVRKIALDAVNQATDFGGLFVGMSFFLIIAALILLGLLYVFGLQQRASEMGLLLAIGYSRRRVRALFLLEALPTGVLGTTAGAGAGVAYAWLLLAALDRFWPAAVAGTTIHFHAEPMSLLLGSSGAMLCALLVVAGGVWRGTRQAPRVLLSADFTSAITAPVRRAFPGLATGATAALLLAVGAIAYVALAQPPSMIEPFFSVGFFVLAAELGYYGCLLRYLARKETSRHPSLWKFVFANLARRRGRSLSVAGLTACGCFLVFSVASMQENVGLHATERNSGTGGFSLFAESTVPLLAAPPEIARQFQVDTVPLRVRDGDDAGCLNLNHAQTPRLFGVEPQRLSRLGAFDAEVWKLLDRELPDGLIPALAGDANTAMWGLKKRTGLKDGHVLVYRDESGNEVKFKLVGQLPMRVSLFQGAVLISEHAFTRLFPSEAGFRAFLIDAEAASETAGRLNHSFERYGMQAVPAVERLREFHAVEGTYLSMFLLLGGFGLVLGAGGVGIVVLRNVFERRGEIALLNAVGFEERSLFRLFLAEHGLLVLAGMLMGALAAAAAIFPLALLSQTEVSPASQAVLFVLIVAANLAATALALQLGFPRRAVQYLREE